MSSIPEFSVGLQDILEAERQIKPFIHRTPAITSQTIDELASEHDCQLRLIMKCENLQKVGGK